MILSSRSGTSLLVVLILAKHDEELERHCDVGAKIEPSCDVNDAQKSIQSRQRHLKEEFTLPKSDSNAFWLLNLRLFIGSLAHPVDPIYGRVIGEIVPSLTFFDTVRGRRLDFKYTLIVLHDHDLLHGFLVQRVLLE